MHNDYLILWSLNRGNLLIATEVFSYGLIQPLLNYSLQ